ncbi:hypothetical protein GGX14DRAFT_428618 [Mycena pura]|uniref:SAP domain-containing protein n=1 Tax=Mycena pura TaxID=153505 RepID=A0AAD6YKV1_9AGAR|nr:hypothetical protein GGX14DRAFT_428618 [Mycena pura]
MTADSEVAAQDDVLVFPTKAGGTERLTCGGKTQNQLKAMCRDYGLPISGNKSVLKSRLQQFSEKFCNDPASCHLTPANRRKHKGPRDDTKKTKVKMSATRRAAIIDTERVTERSKDTRTAEEKKNLILWADRTVARLPFKPRKPKNTAVDTAVSTGSQVHRSADQHLHFRMQTIENQLAAISAVALGNHQPSSFNWDSATSVQVLPVDYMAYDYADNSLNLSEGPYMVGNLALDIPNTFTWLDGCQSPAGSYDPSATLADILPVDVPVSMTSVPAMATVPVPVPALASSIPNSQLQDTDKSGKAGKATTRTIILGDSTTITISTDEARKVALPATSFAEDIERLNQMWDDTSPHWRNNSVMRIGDHPIALIYWPQIFKKTGLWSAHKSNWTEWKFVVERYRQGTPEEFWATFKSEDGVKMPYTAICAKLRKDRKNTNEELAARAREEYGDDFEAKFSYRNSKTKARMVKFNASSIAKEYKRLQGID